MGQAREAREERAGQGREAREGEGRAGGALFASPHAQSAPQLSHTESGFEAGQRNKETHMKTTGIFVFVASPRRPFET